MNVSTGTDFRGSPENAEYWRAAREGRLLIKRCAACGKSHYYPRARCPFCGDARTEWIEASGIGKIYSFTIVRRAAPPYVPAYVTLAEGVTLLTNIVECAPESVRIEQPVRVVFRPMSDGRHVPMFAPLTVDSEAGV
jgi:uncharacterized OB-fold protein